MNNMIPEHIIQAIQRESVIAELPDSLEGVGIDLAMGSPLKLALHELIFGAQYRSYDVEKLTGKPELQHTHPAVVADSKGKLFIKNGEKYDPEFVEQQNRAVLTADVVVYIDGEERHQLARKLKARYGAKETKKMFDELKENVLDSRLEEFLVQVKDEAVSIYSNNSFLVRWDIGFALRSRDKSKNNITALTVQCMMNSIPSGSVNDMVDEDPIGSLKRNTILDLALLTGAPAQLAGPLTVGGLDRVGKEIRRSKRNIEFIQAYLLIVGCIAPKPVLELLAKPAKKRQYRTVNTDSLPGTSEVKKWHLV